MKTEITITEALAELKTIAKKITSKQQAILQYLYRDSVLRDPLEASGGSRTYIAQERQSLKDLRQRYADIRMAIYAANGTTQLDVQGTVRTVAEWLVWKREIHKLHADELNAIANTVKNIRSKVAAMGKQFTNTESTDPKDVIANIDEAGVLREAEELATIMSTLDGKLSLINATTKIVV